MALVGPLSERQRDPVFKKRSKANRRTVYGGVPVFGAGSKKTTKKTTTPSGDNQSPAPVVDIDAILAKDPFYQIAHGRYLAEGVSDAASRDAAMKRAMIDFGYSPEGITEGLDPGAAKALAGVLDPTTRALIGKNTASGMSVWARLQDAANLQKRDALNAVAARGMSRSGETGYALQRTALAADQGRYDATKSLMDYLTGVQSAFVEAERLRQEKEDAARQKAVDEGDPIFDPKSVGVQMPPAWQPPADMPPIALPKGTDLFAGLNLNALQTGGGGGSKKPPVVSTTPPLGMTPAQRRAWLLARQRAGRM